MKNVILASLILTIFVSSVAFSLAPAPDDEKPNKKEKSSIFRDEQDGAFDISRWVYEANGFMPVPFIITEPAVGYGGGLALVFFKPNIIDGEMVASPNLTGGFGLATENGTWMGGLFHTHSWKRDGIRYAGALVKTSVNLDFYGINDEILSKNPLSFNMDALVVVQRLMFRLANSNFYLGGEYDYFGTENTVEDRPDKPISTEILNRLEGKSTLSLVSAKIYWDNRDNKFTPDTGIYSGLNIQHNSTMLGADDNFWKITPYFIGYQPIGAKVIAGLRFDGQFTSGDVPLYALPFIWMRGVPAMRYQSNNTLLAETEWRFAVYNRWSLVGFGGGGKAFKSLDTLNEAKWIYAYGTGIRYKIARLLGMHAGVDVAWSNEDFAFYLTIGSAWIK